MVCEFDFREKANVQHQASSGSQRDISQNKCNSWENDGYIRDYKDHKTRNKNKLYKNIYQLRLILFTLLIR
jgi:hypothetical protein